MPSRFAENLSADLPREWCWPWSHKWKKWTDKTWSKIVRDRPLFSNVTSTHVETPSEVGTECIQERRCAVCNKLQLRSEQVRL